MGNFVPHLFQTIEHRKNAVLFDRIKHAGITSMNS